MSQVVVPTQVAVPVHVGDPVHVSVPSQVGKPCNVGNESAPAGRTATPAPAPAPADFTAAPGASSSLAIDWLRLCVNSGDGDGSDDAIAGWAATRMSEVTAITPKRHRLLHRDVRDEFGTERVMDISNLRGETFGM
ncbi:MAG: hypothetical protein AB1792_10985 [Candidatus Zixiibacteriota bacterium]